MKALSRLSIFFFLIFSYADKGMLSLTRPGISLYTPAQRAIILWNRGKEVLILSTNLSAQEKTKVLEILPLPSIPEVKEGDFSDFEEVFQLIEENAPKGKDLLMKGKREEVFGVKVLFQKEIGAHNLTAVQVKDYEDFKTWLRSFLEGYSLTIDFPKRLEYLIGRYLSRGIKVFVFDLVDLSEEENSLKPLIYEFKSKGIYFPLEISSLSSGRTEIQLFIFSSEIPAVWFSDTPLDFAYYQFRGRRLKPIIFMVSRKRLKEIFPQYYHLFSSPPYLTSLNFEGEVSELKGDLNLRKFFSLRE